MSTVTCKKQNTLEMELAKLPQATQTGQNTFGCLVNGKAWVAQNKDCFPYCDPSFKMYYDDYRGGSISIIGVNKHLNEKINQQITVAFDSLNYKQLHLYDKIDEIKFSYANLANSSLCTDLHSIDQAVLTEGYILVSKHDLRLNIISGTFEFTLYKPDCDTIKVTHGRFDKKL